jgi:hypothetical protein
MGIGSIRDSPDDYPLNERLRRACTCVQTGEPWFGLELINELKALKYPLYFIDFETVNPRSHGSRACTFPLLPITLQSEVMNSRRGSLASMARNSWCSGFPPGSRKM